MLTLNSYKATKKKKKKMIYEYKNGEDDSFLT